MNGSPVKKEEAAEEQETEKKATEKKATEKKSTEKKATEEQETEKKATEEQETEEATKSSEADPWAAFAVTQQMVADISALPQRSPEWRQARKWRLTGSNFAAAAGHNPFMSPEALVREMLWGTFRGNDATRWGQEHEDGAREMYWWAMRKVHPELSIDEVGLQVHAKVPFLAVSPDGLCNIWNATRGAPETYLLEIKCPYRWKRDRFYDDTVPSYYWDQLQGSMGLLGLRYCHFVVWTPVGMQVNVIHFDERYYADTLLPALLHFYLHLFWPTLCAWREGKLTPPDVITDMPLEINM